ncbi:AAA family ATPase, partial [Streptomyces sp. NPDC059456]|uniref:AAA family ATPase n=1 Tax=Streptomyces sp. NPDC059456 TaxID=3346838 RepID=UPI0036C464BF
MTGPLRERDGARALLVAGAERARSGSGGLVLLQGASGTGRTAVLETAARDAEDRGLRVLWARCSAEDTAVPFATVLQLLGPVPDFADLAPDGDDRGSAARLWRLLRAYAAEGPLLLAVDDVHLADAPSRRWLREAVRRIDRLPVLLVASERSQYDIDPGRTGLARSLPPSLVRTHTIDPLGDTAAAELVRAAVPDADPEWTAQCVRAGAGSPLLLHALLDDLGGPQTAGPAPEAVPPLPDTCAALYPGSYPAAVAWWLSSAGAATTEVARCLAALEEAWPRPAHETDGTDGTDEIREAHEARETREAGKPEAAGKRRTGRAAGAPAGTDVAGVLAEAAGADPARVAGWLTAMTRIGLLRPDSAGLPRFAHRLLRDAVLTGWPTARRQAAHRVAAETMLRRGERVEAVAAHLLRARGGGGLVYPTDTADP